MRQSECSCEDQDRGIDRQREHQGDGAVPSRQPQRLAFGRKIKPEGAGLYDARMQVEVMRHDRRADDAKREVEHRRVVEDLAAWGKACDDFAPDRVGLSDEHDETGGDQRHQGNDQRLDPAEPLVLQPQDQEHVSGCDEDADLEWDAEEEVEADGSADHLG